MGVSIEQCRCAIGSPAPLFRTVKIEQNHDGMLSKMQNYSFKLWSFVGLTMLWLILGNWVMMTEPLRIGMSEITTDVKSTYVTGTNMASTICERTNENGTLTVELIKTLLVIGNIEMNPGPEMQPKLSQTNYIFMN